MRILLLARSFNSLTQRLYVELAARGHELSVEFDIADRVAEEAVALFRPDLVIAPFMKRAIPASVWQRVVCLVVHPGPPGDRGPSALDWAILRNVREWGVTVLQAVAEMDAGPVWSHRTFPMRAASKSSLYRHEVAEAAVAAVLEAVARLGDRGFAPAPPATSSWQPLVTQQARRIDWTRDDTATVLRRLRASDGAPGVLDALFGQSCFLYDGHPGPRVDAPAGTIVARSLEAVLRATTDGSVWIGHCRPADDPDAIKLPVARAYPEAFVRLPERDPSEARGYPDVRYEESGAVGVLHFPFYNGAMSTAQCRRLLDAWRAALARPTRVLVLAGGPEFFSNGIHLNVIEAAASPADESMANIEAMDDLCEAILTTTDRLTVAALQGNAGAGGCFLALACDEVWARNGVILNPHYKNMGNLYGSEYWTYTLPRRVRHGDPAAPMHNRRPISAMQAAAIGLVDRVLDGDRSRFVHVAIAAAREAASDGGWAARIDAKRRRRAQDEAAKPLAQYRREELERMRRNFYGFDSSYHVARSYFVRKTPHSWTPRHLAVHREGARPPSR